MIIDARSIPQGETVETDVCIVGAGTAGITLAREFIGEAFTVCLLESGGMEGDVDTQALYKGANVGLPYYDLDKSRARLFGGSSHRWHVDLGKNEMGLRLRPFDPIDFEERDWVAYSGWPFDKAHLDPYYDRAQTICQIDPPTFAVEDWVDEEKRPFSLLLNDDVETVIYKFGPRKPFIDDYVKEVTGADNITSILYANVLEVETNETAQVATQLRVATLEGNAFTVSARLFILAVGGIETPRLMLLSNGIQTAGLGNEHDLVGRFFMEHLHFWSGVYIPSDPGVFQKTGLYNGVHRVNGVPILGKLALAKTVLRREKLLNQNVQLVPRLVSNRFLYPPLAGNGIGAKMTNAYRKVRRRVERAIGSESKAFQFANMTEQAPNPESRVTLMADKRDALGQNRAQLNWQITRQDMRSIIRTQEIVGVTLQRVIPGQLFIQLKDDSPPNGLHGGYHHMGTTRMHPDPKQGVVDENSRVHSVANLYIAGPAVFPTGGYANPVLTLVALTVRLADHIKNLMEKGE